ncbi:ECs_2282 family putative zinc-binding protein [Pectobacterium polonicum]|uniref:ECs_2282 family putative zinc-binding protein n=1 Tax=Pectobacterium polonicum TaxID=2485124 RepID=UPI003D9A9A93
MSVKIACPNCDGEIIKTSSEVNSLDDLINAICANCGRVITKDDVIAQARKLAIEKIRSAIRKP